MTIINKSKNNIKKIDEKEMKEIDTKYSDYNTKFFNEPNTIENPLFVHYGGEVHCSFETSYTKYKFKPFNIDKFTHIQNRQDLNKPVGFYACLVNGQFDTPPQEKPNLDFQEYTWKNWNKSEQFQDCNQHEKTLFRMKKDSMVLVINTMDDYQKEILVFRHL